LEENYETGTGIMVPNAKNNIEVVTEKTVKPRYIATVSYRNLWWYIEGGDKSK
jgi:hypothetical protein